MTIIHRQFGFILLRSRKTASSSVEIFLAANTALGGDIYATSKEILEKGLPRSRRVFPLPVGQSRNWLELPRAVQRVRSTIRGMHRCFPILHQHDSAARVRFLVGGSFFDSALKAVPIRNPWDALVSYYHWEKSGQQGRRVSRIIGWENWLSEVLSADVTSSSGTTQAEQFLFYEHLFLNGSSVPAFYIRFEDISSSLDELSATLGVKLPDFASANMHLKRSGLRHDYRSYFTDDQAERVGSVFRDYISLTGYHFG